jgi:hypothetical protein
VLSAHLGGVNKRPIIVRALPPSRIKRPKDHQPTEPKPPRIVRARKPRRLFPGELVIKGSEPA